MPFCRRYRGFTMNPIQPLLMATHEVFKQAPTLENDNLYAHGRIGFCLQRLRRDSATRLAAGNQS